MMSRHCAQVPNGRIPRRSLQWRSCSALVTSSSGVYSSPLSSFVTSHLHCTFYVQRLPDQVANRNVASVAAIESLRCIGAINVRPGLYLSTIVVVRPSPE